jgi:hypothetical protein
MLAYYAVWWQAFPPKKPAGKVQVSRQFWLRPFIFGVKLGHARRMASSLSSALSPAISSSERRAFAIRSKIALDLIGNYELGLTRATVASGDALRISAAL